MRPHQRMAPSLEYVGGVRCLLTYDSGVGGFALFQISASDLAVRKEWARMSAIDASLHGTEISPTTIASRAASLPSRAALSERGKKQVNPATTPKSPAPYPSPDG